MFLFFYIFFFGSFRLNSLGTHLALTWHGCVIFSSSSSLSLSLSLPLSLSLSSSSSLFPLPPLSFLSSLSLSLCRLASLFFSHHHTLARGIHSKPDQRQRIVLLSLHQPTTSILRQLDRVVILGNDQRMVRCALEMICVWCLSHQLFRYSCQSY